MKLEDTIKGFGMIVDGKLDHIPEQAFYMAGTIDEVIERGRRGGHEAEAESAPSSSTQSANER